MKQLVQLAFSYNIQSKTKLILSFYLKVTLGPNLNIGLMLTWLATCIHVKM